MVRTVGQAAPRVRPGRRYSGVALGRGGGQRVDDPLRRSRLGSRDDDLGDRGRRARAATRASAARPRRALRVACPLQRLCSAGKRPAVPRRCAAASRASISVRGRRSPPRPRRRGRPVPARPRRAPRWPRAAAPPRSAGRASAPSRAASTVSRWVRSRAASAWADGRPAPAGPAGAAADARRPESLSACSAASTSASRAASSARAAVRGGAQPGQRRARRRPTRRRRLVDAGLHLDARSPRRRNHRPPARGGTRGPRAAATATRAQCRGRRRARTARVVPRRRSLGRRDAGQRADPARAASVSGAVTTSTAHGTPGRQPAAAAGGRHGGAADDQRRRDPASASAQPAQRRSPRRPTSPRPPRRRAPRARPPAPPRSRASARTVTSPGTRPQDTRRTAAASSAPAPSRGPGRARARPPAPASAPAAFGLPLARDQLARPAPARRRAPAPPRRHRSPRPSSPSAIDPGRLDGHPPAPPAPRAVRASASPSASRQPLDLLGGRGDAGAQRLDPAGERRQPLPPVGQRPDRGQVGPLGGGERRLVLGPRLQHAPRARAGPSVTAVDQLGLLLGDGLGLGLQLVGVAPRRRASPASARCRARSGASRDGAAEALRQRREPVPGLLCGRPAAARPRPARPPSRCCSARAAASCSSTLDAAGPGGRLVGHLAGQLVAQGDEVVGEQPQPGVPQLGLHRLRPRAISACRPSGLSWRRSSPVRSVSRVRLACIASSLRSAFSLRLRCLRTPAASSMNAAPVLRARRCRTASSWPCPTMTCISRPIPRVAEQLLDVEQPAGCAVDLVLALAVAEHPAGDRHLGVVDRQRAVGVVDRQRDLGPAERGDGPTVPAKMTSSILPPRRAFAPCSPSTQAMASTTLLLPEPFGPTTQVIPGSRRSVVGRGEGLEAPQRQGLEVHRAPRPAATPSGGAGQGIGRPRQFWAAHSGFSARRSRGDHPERRSTAPRPPGRRRVRGRRAAPRAVPRMPPGPLRRRRPPARRSGCARAHEAELERPRPGPPAEAHALARSPPPRR